MHGRGGFSLGFLLLPLLYLQAATQEDDAAWDRRFAEAQQFREQNRSAEAARLFEECVRAAEQFPQLDRRRAVALNNLAEAWRDLGRTREAEWAYRRALDIFERQQPGVPAMMARVALNLAELHLYLRQHSRAEPLYAKAHETLSRVLPPDHIDLAEGLIGMALMAQYDGRAAEAEPLYRRALALIERHGGSQTPYLTAPLMNLAIICRDTGRSSEARTLFERTIGIAESGSQNDVALALAQMNLAELEWKRDESGAESRFQTALRHARKAQPGDPLATASVMRSYADFLRSRERRAEASRLDREAKAFRRRIPAPPTLSTP
jgi:tetratricopeptide (TPR) repeat protein